MDENLRFACSTLADWATLHGIHQARAALKEAGRIAGVAAASDELAAALRALASGELPAEPEPAPAAVQEPEQAAPVPPKRSSGKTA